MRRTYLEIEKLRSESRDRWDEWRESKYKLHLKMQASLRKEYIERYPMYKTTYHKLPGFGNLSISRESLHSTDRRGDTLYPRYAVSAGRYKYYVVRYPHRMVWEGRASGWGASKDRVSDIKDVRSVIEQYIEKDFPGDPPLVFPPFVEETPYDTLLENLSKEVKKLSKSLPDAISQSQQSSEIKERMSDIIDILLKFTWASLL